jgi:hypothetical protein
MKILDANTPVDEVNSVGNRDEASRGCSDGAVPVAA